MYDNTGDIVSPEVKGLKYFKVYTFRTLSSLVGGSPVMAAHYPPCLNYVDIPNTFFNIFTRAAVYLANIVLIITNQDIVVADSHIHSDFL